MRINAFNYYSYHSDNFVNNLKIFVDFILLEVNLGLVKHTRVSLKGIVSIPAKMGVSWCVCIYVYMYICVYVCIYMHIYTIMVYIVVYYLDTVL